MSEPNPVVHFEMGYQDRARMVKFYETAFGWETVSMGPDMGNYVVAHTTATDDKGMVQTPGAIHGGFYQKTDDPLSQEPSEVVSVDDIGEAMAAVVAAGGKILGGMDQNGNHTEEPQMIPDVGLWISAMDTKDNRFSILQAGNA